MNTKEFNQEIVENEIIVDANTDDQNTKKINRHELIHKQKDAELENKQNPLFTYFVDKISELKEKTAKIKEMADEKIKESNQKRDEALRQIQIKNEQINEQIKKQNILKQEEISKQRQKHKTQMEKIAKIEKLLKNGNVNQEELNALIDAI